jgi:hypothetical protein
MGKRLLWAGLALVLAAAPAAARSWSTDPAAQAEDYSIITDSRPNHEIAILMWISAPMARNAPPTALATLDQYVLLGAVHGQLNPGGTMDFDPQPTLTPTDDSGKALKVLTGDNVPPLVQGAVTAFGGAMRQSMGAMGQGMHFFVFEAGDVHACSKGRMTVAFAGTNYTYDTPIPGCPKP